MIPICPECKAEKHRNCNGGAWDDATDAPTECHCWASGHYETFSTGRQRYDVEGEMAHRESDHLQQIHERRLP